LTTVESLPGNGPSCHATGVKEAVEVQPFPAEKTPYASMAQGLLDEAVKGNPTTTVIPGVDENKSSPRTIEDLTEPQDPRIIWAGNQQLAIREEDRVQWCY